MTRIDFYHLQKQNLEEVLPKLLEKAYALKKKIKVKVGNEMRVEFLNTHLWTYREESFLPHGTRKDGAAEFQPIWLSAEDDNPNHAELLFLVDGAETDVENADSYTRIFNIFDGRNPDALEAARRYWKKLKNAGTELHYWQQDSLGHWAEKGS